MLGYLRRHHWGLLAAFIALGGTAYATGVLPRNSVGTPQLKRGAVTLSKISSGARATLRTVPSDGYFVSSNSGNPTADGNTSISVHVPPGKYLAHGGCTATNTVIIGSPTTYIEGFARLKATGAANYVESTASVPSQGSGGAATGEATVGTASLSTSAGFNLPRGGTITEECRQQSIDLQLTAARVASLH